MVDAQLHDKIEQYLLGDLSPEDSARFELEIKADIALFEQVEIQRMGLLGVQRMADADLHDKFSKWDEALDGGTVPKHKAAWGWTSTGLLLLLTAVAILYYQQSKKIRTIKDREKQENARRDSTIQALQFAIKEKEAEIRVNNSSEAQSKIIQLEEELRNKEVALNAVKTGLRPGSKQIAMLFGQLSDDRRDRGTSNKEDSILSAASKAYESGQFSKSVNLLKKIPLNDQRYTEVRRVLPYALFYDGKFEAAKKAFQDLKDNSMFDVQKAEWFMVLCNFGEGRKAEALKGIDEILKHPQHQFNANAEVLKRVLEGK